MPPPETPPVDMVQSVLDALAPILPTLRAVSMALDEMCAINGHRWNDSVTYRDKAVCTTCGRFYDEVHGTGSAETIRLSI